MPQTYDFSDEAPQGKERTASDIGQVFGQQALGQQTPGGQAAAGQQAQQARATQEARASQAPQQAQAAQVQQQAAQPGAPGPGQQRAQGQAGASSQPPAGAQTAAAAYANMPPIAYVPVQQVPQKKGHGWIVALVLIVCLFALTAFCVKSCTDVVTNTGMYGSAAGPGENSIAVIDIDGTIQYDGTACSPEGLKSLLDQAQDNDNIKGVVLRVNSGGGVATAGEEMADYVRDFGKPIVVSSASLNASAAYEISSQANYIYVAKTTEIGSIGTALELTDLSGLFNMLGIDVNVITSSESKDSTYGYRALSDEEREYYQRMVNQINDIFIENVASGRAMTVEEVKELATGLVFTGIDAVDNGLADEVGTLEDAVAKAADLAGVSDYNTYDLVPGSYDFSSLYYLLGGSGQDSSQKALPALKQ